MSARAIAIHGNEMSGERRANLEIKSECPALIKVTTVKYEIAYFDEKLLQSFFLLINNVILYIN